MSAKDGDDSDDAWYLTGETTDGRPLQPFATMQPFVTLESIRDAVIRIREESGSPLDTGAVAHPDVAERIANESRRSVELYTCGAIQACAMVVTCECGLIRQHDRPHDYVADVQLRGWICYCGIFNGEEKERMTTCRTCGAPRPI